jgi:hypothetical protein
MSYYTQNTISASDPQAIEKLTAKLKKAKELQSVMKEVNAYWRKLGTCVGAPGITEEQAKKLDTQIASTSYSWDKIPFSSYTLTNNNADIKRMESRIKELTRNKEVGFSGWEFEGGRAEANTEANRLQLFFDERTTSEQHSTLRHAGFVYSHTNGAYQRQLNDNAIYAANRIDFIKPTDGRSVREHQPKAPVREDTGAR